MVENDYLVFFAFVQYDSFILEYTMMSFNNTHLDMYINTICETMNENKQGGD